MQSVNFIVDKDRCTGCEECISDCPLLVLTMKDGSPSVVPDKASLCINCMHCLTICPTGAVSIGGYTPDACLPTKDTFPAADKVEALIRGRRSVRSYSDENIAKEKLHRLLQVAWQAPTGVNARGVLFTVIDDNEVMNTLRKEIMSKLAELVRTGSLPDHLKFYAGFVKLWEEKNIDTLFRGAPHMIIASAPKHCPCPEQDCIIALSYFELFAQSLGIGTVWDGLAKRVFSDLMPELVEKLNIPSDHTLGYVMAFGKPAVQYHRTLPLRSAAVNRVSL